MNLLENVKVILYVKVIPPHIICMLNMNYIDFASTNDTPNIT